MIRVLGQLLTEEQLRTNLRNAADAQKDAVQAFIKRVAVVAIEEHQRLALLQLSPKLAKQFDLPVRFKDPTELLVLSVGFPDAQLFVFADAPKVLFTQPAVW